MTNFGMLSTEAVFEMKHYVKAICLIVLTLAFSNSILGMRTKSLDDQPVVVEAAVPSYSLRALASNAAGEVIVEVRIDSRGLVKSVRTVSGQAILAADSKRTARRWKFAPQTDKATVRIVQLTFVYRLVPRDTPFDQLLPVFKLPYRVEVAHTVPETAAATRFSRLRR
jgi:TonB family protein